MAYYQGARVPTSKLMAFIDGENLTIRYEEMLKTRSPNPDSQAAPVHQQGDFVWSPMTLICACYDFDVVRAHYYTTFTGDDPAVATLEETLAKQVVRLQSGARAPLRLIPRIFKKTSKQTKVKSVDINICVDMLEYVKNDAVDAVMLVTGDVDYLPLIDAVMKAGKVVFLGALSSGRSSQLVHRTDRFIDLDQIYFAP